MSICFDQIYSIDEPLDWMKQPFQGFNLDSRHIQQGQIFIALNSLSQPEKTRQFALKALENGALAVVSESDLQIAHALIVPNVRHLMGIWQKEYLQAIQPVDLARIVAVTGTNGKTTISRLVAELLLLQQRSCAVMGTTGNGILPNLEVSTHTTLDALQLQSALYGYAQLGARFAAIEASSHGLVQGRLQGCDIEVAVYSNLSRDHLDYHGTLEAYAEAKSRLFAFTSLKVAIINIDDAHAHIMLNAAKNNPSQPKILTYSTTQVADYRVDQIQYDLTGVKFNLHYQQHVFSVNSPLLGHFNIENLVASLIAVHQLGFDLEKLLYVTPQLKGAPGRMQVIRDVNRLFVVDYAHTPDALVQVLQTLKRHVTQRLWVVFGCGGDRDRGKRPLMTQAALNDADVIVMTSDNPRSENPEQIFADMKAGINVQDHHFYEIHDRREAIKFAIAQAQQGDIVVIAGKGHENYQEIQGVRHWFDDAVEVNSALQMQNCKMTSAYPAQ